MATGDAAAAAGLDVFALTDDARDTYDALNVRGDELANHITLGTHPASKITGTIATAQIANGAVTNPKLGALAVATSNMQDSAITTAKINANAVTTAKIANLAVTGDKLANTLTKAATFTVQGAPLVLQTVNTNHGIEISTSGVEVESTAAASMVAPSLKVESTNGANGLVVGTGTAVVKSGTSTTVQSAGEVSLDAGSAGVSITSDGPVEIDADGTATLGGSSVSVESSVGGVTIDGNGQVNIGSGTALTIAGGSTTTITSGGSSSTTLDAGGVLFLEAGTQVRSTTIYGNTSSGTANVYIDGNGNLLRSTSSLRYKADVEDAEEMPSLLDVQPRTWRDKNAAPDDERRWYGAIAEELHDLGLGHLVAYDASGAPEAIYYDRVAIALIPHVRAMRDAYDSLAARVAALESKES